MSRGWGAVRRTVRVAAAVLVLGIGLSPVPAASGSELGWRGTGYDAVDYRDPYPGDPKLEAGLVAAEDNRLVEVNTVDSLARWSETALNTPYRLLTGSAYTLVLTPRSEVYTVEDLLGLAPQTFVRQPDGSYLLSEHLVIQSGATLNLTSSGGLRLRLASDKDGFVSIVNYGGRLNLIGARGAPVEVTSWDRIKNAPDKVTEDGRAYVRSLGGQVAFEHVHLSDLGFWSGRTGGLSLTGNDRPNSGSLDELGETMEVGKQATRERAAMAALQPPEPEKPGLDGTGRATLSQVLPAGALPVPEVNIADPEYSYVSAALQHTTVEGNAFGLFVSSANGVDIRTSAFNNSLVDGLTMHRYVTNAVVEATTASHNGGDGIVLARATTGIVLSEITATDNARNGITASGLPLADGPSATGISVDSYGNNSVANSTMSGNGHYGVEVIGGTNIGVQANDVAGNDMGIVVRDGADDVSVVGNRVTDSTRQGIALRDGVRQAVVSGNIVSGGPTSVYLRDTEATVQRNTLTGASMHAVSFVGDVSGSRFEENAVSGRGPSAIDAQRAVNFEVARFANDTSGWTDTTPFLVTLKRFLQPLTALWILLGLLVLFTAVRGVRSRRRFAHPYADKAPLPVNVLDEPTSAEGVR